MIEFQIKYSIITIIIVILFYLLIRKKIDLLETTFFLLPFNQIVFHVGLNLAAYQFFIILLWIVIFLNKKKIVFQNIYLMSYIAYSIIITLLVGLLYMNNVHSNGGFFRGEGRMFAQIFLFILLFSLVPIVYVYVNKIEDILKYTKSFLFGLVVLSLLGMIQWLIYTQLNIDIFPLSLRDGLLLSGKDLIDGQLIFRISSLGGEPKGFAISLAIGFMILQTFNIKNIQIFKYDNAIKIIFFISLLFTLSTSGYVLFFILLIILLLSSLTKEFWQNKRTIKYIIALVIILLFSFIMYHDMIYSVLEKRIFSRNITSEDFDLAVKFFLFNQPKFSIGGVGLGNVHNFAFNYLPITAKHYMMTGIFIAKSGYLKLLSEVGIIGSILFYIYNFNIYIKLKNRYLETDNKQIYNAFMIILVIVTISYLARVYSSNIYLGFFSLASVLAYKNFNLKEDR